LNNHLTTLEELDFEAREFLDRSLFQVIAKFSANLRKLHLNSNLFVGSDGEPIDYTFLKDLKQLKDFQIRQPYIPNENVELLESSPGLFESLPRYQLQRLGFEDVSERGFWGAIAPDLEFKRNLLTGFRNLNHLSFCRCASVDDQMVQVIFREIATLLELEMSHCHNVTDDGITGNPQQRDSVSIRNLKGKLVLLWIHKIRLL